MNATEGRGLESAVTATRRVASGPGAWDFHPWRGRGGGLQGTDPLTALGRARPWSRSHQMVT